MKATDQEKKYIEMQMDRICDGEVEIDVGDVPALVDVASISTVDEDGNGAVSLFLWGKHTNGDEKDQLPFVFGIVEFTSREKADEFKKVLGKLIDTGADALWNGEGSGGRQLH